MKRPAILIAAQDEALRSRLKAALLLDGGSGGRTRRGFRQRMYCHICPVGSGARDDAAGGGAVEVAAEGRPAVAGSSMALDMSGRPMHGGSGHWSR